MEVMQQITNYQLDAFLLGHVLAVVGVHESVEVGAARTADGGRLPDKRATDGNGVDLTALVLVPTGDNDASGELKNVIEKI